MNAKILPLEGKYYGTIITFDVPGFGEQKNHVWIVGDGLPSERQLEAWGMSLQAAQEDGIMLDSLGHYETKISYAAAEMMVKFLDAYYG